MQNGGTLRISIHAPRTGSDWRNRQCRRQARRFQSTLPARGATAQILMQQDVQLLFQSTLPARGATRGERGAVQLLPDFNPRSPHGERRTFSCAAGCAASISIHAPRTGSDAPASSVDLVALHFNPRSPHGERPVRRDKVAGQNMISIHAPRTGSDFRALPLMYT